MTDHDHRERHFEAYVLERLRERGWRVGDTRGYDTERALYPEDVLGWLRDSQEDRWERMLAAHQLDADLAAEALLNRLAQALDKHGTLHVLRRGFTAAGCGAVEMSEAAPEDRRNLKVIERYQANRLRVVPQLHYHPTRKLAIDLVLFINGLPVATVELKTDFTQSADAAMEQYKTDRLPQDPKTRRKEPLLSFKRGAIVYFAMSDSDIRMTTHLDGESTRFLPFNQGHEGRAGNPPRADGEYPVAHFWEQICVRDAWLRIFHSFVYIERKPVVDLQGNWSTRETLIFPRFHQWSAVNAMVEDARAHGPGMQYLCEHSAGSGKTSTIAWTAHDLVKLRRDGGAAVFDSVIVVTDRTVLDSQLQEAIKQIDHQFGVIAAIDRQKSSKSKSQQLAEALIAGTPIIVVTIQTFPYALEAIVTEQALKHRSFAVIIDEAHASQTGSNATKLQAALALGSDGGTAGLTIEELLEKLQRSRKRPRNLSHFAFTATPKHSTCMLFGRTRDGRKASKQNLPESFHKYSMRQAIDEGFILDVLQGYTPYKTAFNLAKQAEDQHRVSGRQAKRALAQWMSLHPTNVTQKVQFIIEHFSRNVAHLLDGKAKAMVVTSSRAAAVRFKIGFDRYIERHPQYAGIRSLVAFSGKLNGKQVMHSHDERIAGDAFDVDEKAEFTEATMNPGVDATDLRVSFDRPEYRVMLVADKFQTGFDQPRLVAMYLDKPIANDVEIVQTLSRLNRTAPGKDRTFVVDFVNDPQSVRRAFARYDAGAVIEDVQDANVVIQIREQLDAAELYETADLEKFKQARFALLREPTKQDGARHKALYAATEQPTRRFKERVKALREVIAHWEEAYEAAGRRNDSESASAADNERRQQGELLGRLLAFRSGLGRFCRAYTYIAQIFDFGDPELENFAAFAHLLQKRLNGEPKGDIDLNGIVLSGYDIKARDDAARSADTPKLEPIGPGGDVQQDLPAYLMEIIARLNHLFGDATPVRDQAMFVNHIAAIASESDTVMAQVENNTREQALLGNLPGAVKQGVVRALTSHQKLATLVLKSDRQALEALTDVIYDLLKEKRVIEVRGLDAGR